MKSVIIYILIAVILFPSLGYLIGSTYESNMMDVVQTQVVSEQPKCVETNHEKFAEYDRITYDCGNEIRICDNKSGGYWSCFYFDTTIKYYDKIDNSTSQNLGSGMQK